MELLALVLVNIVFGIILYYAVSIKIANTSQDYHIQKVKKEIQTQTLNFYKESENYLALMDSKITAFRNLIAKAESLNVSSISLDDDSETKEQLQSKREKLLEEAAKYHETIVSDKDITPKKITLKNAESNYSKNFQDTKVKIETVNENEFGFLASLGRTFKSMFGMESSEELLPSKIKQNPIAKSKSALDVSVGGNPLLESNTSKSNQDDFYSFLQKSFEKDNNSVKEEKIKSNISEVLEELPENSTKIEKVVHLIRAGFSHSEISDELSIGIPEIVLIETIKLERGRRV
ncbi:MAG: hypothetical protein SFU98_06060 [Leptospiraceae bacterium]|nr:hypothetical protein [Leptospiraceae bacterium]